MAFVSVHRLHNRPPIGHYETKSLLTVRAKAGLLHIQEMLAQLTSLEDKGIASVRIACPIFNFAHPSSRLLYSFG